MNPKQPEYRPQVETLAPSPESLGKAQEQTVEAPTSQQETVAKQPPAPVIPSISSLPPVTDTPVLASAQPSDDQSLVGQAQGAGVIAEDKNRIEKQWVERAKAIVAQTQDDPYRQKNEMSKVKAEYIQKRFNKGLKIDSTQKP